MKLYIILVHVFQFFTHTLFWNIFNLMYMHVKRTIVIGMMGHTWEILCVWGKGGFNWVELYVLFDRTLHVFRLLRCPLFLYSTIQVFLLRTIIIHFVELFYKIHQLYYICFKLDCIDSDTFYVIYILFV